MQEVLFKANPGPQTEFLQATEQEVLYGGAAGGGKTFSLVVDPVRDFNNKYFNGLLLRKTLDELREIENISKRLYPLAIPGSKFKEREKTWVMPRGAQLWLSYLDRDDDVLRYQGQAFTWSGFDELTHWPSPYAWNYISSRLRTTTGSGLQIYQRATCNPGGLGHQWVKKAFIDPAPYNTAFDARDIETGEILKWPKGSLKEGQALFKRRFIPAKLADNPYLHKDGKYEANLLALPEHQRKQLLEGNWDTVEGAAFSEFNRDIHVIPYYDLPSNWIRFRAADYGYSSHTGVLWLAYNSKSGQLVVYRELYVQKVHADDLADMIAELEQNDRVKYGVLDSSLWHKRGDRGPCIADQMSHSKTYNRHLKWRPADRSKGSRVASKNLIHQAFRINPYLNEPNLIFMDNCRNLIAQIPMLPLDKSNPEDVDTKSEDHLYDALRYGVASKPRNSFTSEQSYQETFTPFDKQFGY